MASYGRSKQYFWQRGNYEEIEDFLIVNMESVYGINKVEIDAEAQPTYDSFLHFLLLSQPSKDMAPVRPLCVRHPACETTPTPRPKP